jgi:hypothetical protein
MHENNLIIVGSFFDLFPLGRQLPSQGTMPAKFVRHLLLQYDQRFSLDQQLLCLLFNQRQRQAANSVVRARVSSNPKLISELSNIINDENFEQRLQRGIVEPGSSAAQQLLRELMPAIRLAGKKIPYGRIERSECLPEMYSYCNFFGTPSWYWTVAPSDIDSRMVLRLSGVLDENAPAPSFLFRATQVAKDPVSAARFFQLIVESFVECLVNMSPENMRREVKNREGGLFGVRIAAYNVYESQGRGTLHLHGLGWGWIPPQLFTQLAHDPACTAALAEIIDSYVTAQIPEDVRTHATEHQNESVR